MNKKQRWTIVSAVVLMIACGVGFMAFMAFQQPQRDNNNDATSPSSSSIPSEERPSAEEPSGIFFENAELGFSLYYPEGWLMLECEDQPNTYFASDERGLGMQNGESILCGGGTGFPPQVGTRVRDKSEAEQYMSEYPTTAVIIDNKEAHKLTYTDTDGPHPGMETTLYLVDMGETYLEFAYNKWPDGENYDTSEESRHTFTTMIEETVRFTP